ncbi:RNA-binding S4 domain-containing protein [Changpingibacter yushuensis]|uniref:RNA-binding S4 domain-containing protein n=1 Tax=Changpingibacter yushuensis TaxID=2758440 RepID=UPI0015F5CAEC|nr:RNA-binding S4 domain-containing protein [Changpingibacter yushuensis]
MDRIEVTLPIKLGQFVKLASLAESGSEAREMIELGDITVNGVVETRRGHHLSDGDVVALETVHGEIAVELVALEE